MVVTTDDMEDHSLEYVEDVMIIQTLLSYYLSNDCCYNDSSEQ